MILLDAHIWVWWFSDNPDLPRRAREVLESSGDERLGVSVISCWELGMLVAKNRVRLSMPVETWVSESFCAPRMDLLDLTPPIAIASSHLPGEFHGDPADRIIVATARLHDCPVLTADGKMLDYPHVKTIR
jgi:PIN domain nuclease of toxin-antitoxin system